MAFTWTRSRVGGSAGDGTAELLSLGLAVYPPGTPTTIRRIIIDWGMDVLSGAETGTVNTKSPFTLGLTYTTGSTDTPAGPTFGPATEPFGFWPWWQGIWYTNAYGFTTDVGAAGAMTATGRIDRKNPTDMPADVYTKWWLVFEMQDVDAFWSSYAAQCWYQILTAPTIS